MKKFIKLTRFYWVLLGSSMFYRVLLGLFHVLMKK